jgi:hypothetical protein
LAAENLELDFHGVRASVYGPAGSVIDDLRRDFAYFLRPCGGGRRGVSLRLEPGRMPAGRAPSRGFFTWRDARISQAGSSRLVDYGGKALLEYDLKRESGVLYGGPPGLLHEIAYLAILSRVGNGLDEAGLHRVHALGFAYRGLGGLLLMPMGGGKSRLALELIRRPGFEILSDDTPLLDGGLGLRAFPLRLGLRGRDRFLVPPELVRRFERRRFGVKYLVDLDFFKEKIAPRAPLRWILTGARGSAAGALMSGMVLGVGLPQVLELMLPSPPFLGGALSLARIVASRSAAAARALSTARCASFRIGGDVRADARDLELFLESTRPG